MNIPLKHHLTIKMFSPTNITSWFITRITRRAFLSRVRRLMQHQEEEQEQSSEPMPIALATLLRRVDELAAPHTSLEECIRQTEREWEWQGQKRNRREEVKRRKRLALAKRI